jgi:glycosyltransferase involved in cell wall biosynthesis
MLMHVFPSFGIGGVPLRMVRILNHFQERYSHLIIALDGNFDASARLAEGVDTELCAGHLPKQGLWRSLLSNVRSLHGRNPDLLLTYNWGAIEWAMANRLFPAAPHLHFEAGFGREEADVQLRRRVWCRRWALARSARVVVPSRRLENLAKTVWRLPDATVTYLPNGVDVERFASVPKDAVPGFTRRPNELVIGTVAPLRPEKNIGRLLRVFAKVDHAMPIRLIVAGDGPERGRLEKMAAELDIAEQVMFIGRASPEAVLGAFDIFVLSSDTEQMPNALLEAMAAGCAVVAVNVGDIDAMVSEENRKFIVPRDDEAAFVSAIEVMLRADDIRPCLGRHNRERAVAEYSDWRMFLNYDSIFQKSVSKNTS